MSKELKAPDKVTQKMTRDGAIAENLTTGETSSISERPPEENYSAPAAGAAEKATQRIGTEVSRHLEKGAYADELISPVRSRRNVWQINTASYRGGHFAAFPPKLAETCILAGCPVGGIVLDPFLGSGTTAAAAKSLSRRYVGIEINPEYCTLAKQRIGGDEH